MSASPAKQTATVSRVTTGTSAVTLLAAGANRSMFTIVNESAAVLSVKFGSAAAANDYTVAVAAGGYYEAPIPVYGGLITGILATGSGFAQVTAW